MPFAEVETYRLLEYTLYKPFDRIHYVFYIVNETHLYVDLSEFGLTVRAQVFVAETFGYLEISVETRDHEQLFIELRRLRKSVETTLVYS